MKFGQPLWFAALALLPLLAALYVRGETLRKRALSLLVAPRLQPELAASASLFRRRLSFLLLLAGLACVILALTEPRYGEIEETRTSVGRDILIAMDTSRSMLANDLAPTRLARARLVTQDLVGKLHGDRVGVIAFAGGAFLQAPLTIDYPAVLSSLQALDTNTIPVGGTNIASAIRCAADAFGKGESDQRALLIFTDGEELDEDAVKAAREAAGSMRIFTVGIGSPEGTVIALPGQEGGGTEYLKSPEGQIVKSSLDETRLRAIAEAGGGFYVRLQNGPSEMETILHSGLDSMSRHEAEGLVIRRPLERYRWPLAAGLFLLAASLLPGERRRSAAAAALLLLAAVPVQGANAGLNAYDQGDFPAALDSFEKQLERRPDFAPLQYDSGNAAYRAGDLDKALDYYARALTSKEPGLRHHAEYNLGNTLLQRGAAQTEREPKLKDLRNAVQHYDSVLTTAPDDEDAKYNRDLAQKLIAELEKQPPPQKKQQKQSGKGQKDKDQDKGGDPSQGQSGDDPSDSDQQGGEEKQGEPKDGKDGKDSPDNSAKGQHGQTKEDHEQANSEGQQAPRNLSGKIADQAKPPSAEGQAPGEKEEQQAQEDAKAAAEGKMTPAQATALLDSLKSADDRVSLLTPSKEKHKERTIRDW